MSKEQGTKRLLSPESTNAKPDDKRVRNDSIEIDDQTPSQIPNMEGDLEQPLTLADLKKTMDIILSRLSLTASTQDLKGLATKDDIKVLDDRITAQGTEISQLRNEMKTIQGKFNDLQNNVDSQTAANLTRDARSLGRDPGNTRTSMADPKVNTVRTDMSRRRNLVFEGLIGSSESEMKASVIAVASAIGVTVYLNEIEYVVRMSRRDQSNAKPGPVLVTLTRVVIHDMILKKKKNLGNITGFESVFVNADETIEVRRAKSFIRKASFNAQQAGEKVEFRHDRVTINDVQYGVNDVERIPAKFLKSRIRSIAEENGQEMDINVSGAEEGATANTVPIPKPILILKGERMRITRRGLVFSGPTAYISNLSRHPLRYDNKSFNCNEKGFQWRKAMDHHDPELAEEIKDTDEPYEIKAAGGIITESDEWTEKAPDLLEDMLEKKLDQNPKLLKRLLETFPLDLIEGSTDTKWGGGAPFHSQVYDKDGPLPGKNIFGKIATNVRNIRIGKLKQLEVNP